MITRTTRRLLMILLAAVFAAAFGIGLELTLERLSAARQKVARYESDIARLRLALAPEADLVMERDKLRAGIAARASRFFTVDSVTPYTFGELVKQKLASLSLKVLRYQVVELKGRSLLEFSVTGSAKGMVIFLHDVSHQDKYWSIPSLTITAHPGGGMVDMVFRTGYEMVDSKSN